MDHQARRRRFALYILTTVIIGGSLLIASSWAKRVGLIDGLGEDVLQAIASFILYLPLLILIGISIDSVRIRRVVIATLIVVVIWRLIDITDEMPIFHRMPLLGADSSFQSSMQHLGAIAVGTLMFVLFLLIFDELTVANSKLNASNARLEQLFENMPVASFTFDRRGLVKSWNREAVQVYGYTAEEAVRTSYLDLIVTPETKPAADEVIANVFQGQSINDTLCRDRNKSGDVGWRMGHVFPIFGSEGDVEYGVSMNVDVTELKQTEAAAERERDLLRRLFDLQERERQTLALDLHDGLIQYAVGAQLRIEACRCKKRAVPRDVAEEIEIASGLLKRAVGEGRRLISGIRPLIIDEAGVIAAIDHLIQEIMEKDDVAIEFVNAASFDRLEPLVESTLYRIVQEALTNILRHSEATSASLTLSSTDDEIRLEIEDFGKGFSVADIPASRFGVRGITERARLFGGTATVDSAPGRGTRIHVELPASLAPELIHN